MREFFDRYIKNWNCKIKLDEQLLSIGDKEKWVVNLKERSRQLREMFRENVSLINGMKEFLQKRNEGETLAAEEAAGLYDGIMNMYYEDCDDFEVMDMLLPVLITYYTKRADYNRLANLYAVRLYQRMEIMDRLNMEVTTDMIMSDAMVLLGYRYFYERLEPESRRKIFSNYYNIIIVNMDNGRISMDTSYYYLQEMLVFWHSPIVQRLDGDNEKIKDVPDRTRMEWLGYNNKVRKSDPIVQKYYMDLSDEFYAREKAGGREVYVISYEIVGSHIATRCWRGEITPEEGFYELADYYVKRRGYIRKSWKQEDVKLVNMSFDYMDYLYFYINVPMMILDWIKDYDISKEVYTPYLKSYIDDLHEVWGELYYNLPGPFLDHFVMDVCMEMLNMDDEITDEEEWLNKFLVKRDLTTYIHSTMVAKLARTIAERMLKHRPQIFSGVFGKDVTWIEKHCEELLDYTEKAGYFHDVGKTRIGDVINTQTRRINDQEFAVIKEHPPRGGCLVEENEVLKKYRDVILGHHKFYDGTKGYPADFDNTASPVRPVIDLVTICDCIDAATDILGRNYAAGKDYAAVLAEINAGKGTRFNPFMAEYLTGDTELSRKISYMVSEGRTECYYGIYEEYLNTAGAK